MTMEENAFLKLISSAIQAGVKVPKGQRYGVRFQPMLTARQGEGVCSICRGDSAAYTLEMGDAEIGWVCTRCVDVLLHESHPDFSKGGEVKPGSGPA